MAMTISTAMIAQNKFSFITVSFKVSLLSVLNKHS